MLTVGGPRRVRHASVKKYKKTSRLFFRKIDTLPWETGEFTAPPPRPEEKGVAGGGGGSATVWVSVSVRGLLGAGRKPRRGNGRENNRGLYLPW